MKPLALEQPSEPVSEPRAPALDAGELSSHDLEVLAAERIPALRALVEGVGHELTNPLTLVLVNVDYVRHRLDELGDDAHAHLGAGVVEAIDEAVAGARRLRAVVKSFRDMARGDALLGPVDVHDCLEGLLDLAGCHVRGRARLDRSYRVVPPVHANEARLRQVLFDLVTHAVDALPAEGEAIVRIATDRRLDGRIGVAVHASGPGPGDDEIARLFDPRARGPFGGTGLAVCRSLAASFGAEVLAHARGDDGTTFEVLLHAAS